MIDPDTTEIEKWMSLGKNYNPFLSKTHYELNRIYTTEVKNVVKKLVLKSDYVKINFDDSDFGTQLEKLLYTKPLSSNVQNFIGKLSENFQTSCDNFVQSNQNNSYTTNKQLEDLFNIENFLFLEADKNVGYVLMENRDILEQYELLNKKQKFVKVNVDEKTYLNEICLKINSSITFMPNELRKLIPYNLLKESVPSDDHSIGILRILPKVLKLKEISYKNIGKLTSRGIRAATNDPLGKLEKILHFITKFLFDKMKEDFQTKEDKEIPMVVSTSDFIKRQENIFSIIVQ